MRKLLASGAVAAALVSGAAQAAELRGHGGPVRALAVSGDLAVTGSFDTTVIVWSAQDGAARQVLRFHEGGVNAVALLPYGDFVSAGEDGRLAFWRRGEDAPWRVEAAHAAPVAGLAVSPDGLWLASAGWDGLARLTPLGDGAARALTGHQGPVNAVAFLPDGRLASAGHDLTLRLWPRDGGAPLILTLPTPLNALAVAADGEIVAAGADGAVRLIDGAGRTRAEVATDGGPVVGLALSPDGATLAASSVSGRITLIDRAQASVTRVIEEVGPVWSIAFADGGATLLAGGGDRVVRRWDAATGAALDRADITTPDPLAGLGDSRGAQVFRACAACHTLTPDDGARAGPTLHGLFGRRIATAPGYAYSQALRGMEIVWTPETVSALFEHGPAAYTPGTKMPEQRIGDPGDRAALIAFLEERTR